MGDIESILSGAEGGTITYTLATIGRDGRPLDEVALQFDEHAAIAAVADNHGLTTLLRIEDYYEEVEYSVDDLPSLVSNIDLAITAIAGGRSTLSTKLSEIRRLCERALKGRQGVVALPD